MEKSKRGKGDLDDNAYIDRTQVLQEAKQCFMATSVKTKKLIDILTKCIFILLQGEKLAQTEANDLFFHITRLFQYKDKDSTLRRLTFIGIKALSQQAENVYVVTSSLITDVNSSRDDPAIRASALRALCQVLDTSTFTSIERYLKQSVVDKHPVVASAAISSLVRIAQSNNEIVRRCTDEIQEALNSDSPMVQYHALGLRYNSCKNDRQALSKLITECIQQALRSPLATCLLIRIISNFINENTGGEEGRVYCDYIKNHLMHRSEMVEYEAANALISFKIETATFLTEADRRGAVSRLRTLLTSPKPALRFAAVRSLNRLAVSSFAVANSSDVRFWSVHRIGRVCKLHLLNKRYRAGDHIIGILDFSKSNVICAKYTVILQCEAIQQFELKQEFTFGLKKNDFTITIPLVKDSITTEDSVLHCVLSFLFYIADKNYPKTLFEDRAGTIELGPSELDTNQFSCDFPIAIHI